jgi:hypothetical protein
MLSKVELEFLRSPESFDSDYRRVLRHRIRGKTENFRREIALLESNGFSVTGNCNGVAEICTVKRAQIKLLLGKHWCGRRDLNPFGFKSQIF